MKKGKKVLSLVLAVSMVFSAVAAAITASAANEKAYTPSYTENVTKEDVADLVTDLDTLANQAFLTGSTVESIYKFLPSLSAIVMLEGSAQKASDQGAFYQTAYPERFADFPDGKIAADVTDENGNITEEGTFTQFFKENPIVCNTPADFTKEIDKIVDLVVIENVVSTITFAFVFGGDKTAGKTLAEGIDNICEALGVQQEKSAADLMGLDTMQGDVEGLRVYVKNVLHAVLPTPVDSILTILRQLTVDSNAALLYNGASKVLEGATGTINSLKNLLGSLGVDIQPIIETVANIKATFESIPTAPVGEGKMIDVEGALSFLAGSLSNNMLAIQFGDASAPAGALIALKFTSMDLTRIAGAKTNGDVLKIVYDYLYSNLIENDENKGILSLGLSILELPQDVKDIANKAMGMSADDLLDYAVDTAAVAAGREAKADPVKPVDPVAPTDPKDPAKPNQPAEPADPAQPETPTEPVETDGQENPDTGDSAMVGMALLALTAAAACVVTRKKK